MPNRRSVFFVSDRTGITAEALGNSLLTQFDGVDFRKTTIPFVDSSEAVDRAISQINACREADGKRPIVISSIVNEQLSERMRDSDAFVLDFFQIFISPLEQELGVKSSHAAGRSHGLRNQGEYFTRIEAINYVLAHDDGQSIKELDWMSPETKAQALEKLAKFRPKIGYPDKWKDYSAIAIRADDLVGNLQRARAFEYADNLARLGKPVDRDEWHMSPQTVNAYYNPSNNEIVFPAAILQPPFFDMQADDAVNYGAIGGVIGHEMGHGFDDQGAKSDGDGVMRDWWTPQDLKEFRFRTSRLVAQYNRFEPIKGQYVNGQFTLGENIGDLGGLTIAHKAYLLSLDGKEAPVLDGFTGEQRFFLGWAQVWKGMYRPELMQMLLASDPHSPPEYRVNGVVPNIPAFYEAFNIQPGDKLYLDPAKRVKIW